ncbi:hypothetical protein Q8A73_003918 [Channa argus]|nr:hypothetical protein Q8A73_003918 [Channa argus]
MSLEWFIAFSPPSTHSSLSMPGWYLLLALNCLSPAVPDLLAPGTARRGLPGGYDCLSATPNPRQVALAGGGNGMLTISEACRIYGCRWIRNGSMSTGDNKLPEFESTVQAMFYGDAYVCYQLEDL